GRWPGSAQPHGFGDLPRRAGPLQHAVERDRSSGCEQRVQEGSADQLPGVCELVRSAVRHSRQPVHVHRVPTALLIWRCYCRTSYGPGNGAVVFLRELPWPGSACRGIAIQDVKASVWTGGALLDAVGHTRGELPQIAPDRGELPLPAFCVDSVQRLTVAASQTVAVYPVRIRQQSNRAVHCLRLALDAADDPLQHAHVLAEARPHEAAVVVLAEPVDVE